MAEAVRDYWKFVRSESIRTGPPPKDRIPPRAPKELTYALRVSIADLRPWEYDAMSAWDYDMIENALRAWEQARRDYPLNERDEPKRETRPIMEGRGPQLPSPRESA